MISRRRRTGVELGKKPYVKLIPKRPYDSPRRDCAAVIYHKHLEAIAWIVLTCQCAQTDKQLAGALIGRDDDRKERMRPPHPIPPANSASFGGRIVFLSDPGCS